MHQQTNPLICDPENGICEIPVIETGSADSGKVKSNKKPVKIIYYTDPRDPKGIRNAKQHSSNMK